MTKPARCGQAALLLPPAHKSALGRVCNFCRVRMRPALARWRPLALLPSSFPSPRERPAGVELSLWPWGVRPTERGSGPTAPPRPGQSPPRLPVLAPRTGPGDAEGAGGPVHARPVPRELGSERREPRQASSQLQGCILTSLQQKSVWDLVTPACSEIVSGEIGAGRKSDPSPHGRGSARPACAHQEGLGSVFSPRCAFTQPPRIRRLGKQARRCRPGGAHGDPGPPGLRLRSRERLGRAAEERGRRRGPGGWASAGGEAALQEAAGPPRFTPRPLRPAGAASCAVGGCVGPEAVPFSAALRRWGPAQ
ncbi:uncharacterized protein [Equus asinus]|uniref:uncharacterized protein n=1 Tax=Equus asinus TaxID=9793 RepID=UPI0038F741FF